MATMSTTTTATATVTMKIEPRSKRGLGKALKKLKEKMNASRRTPPTQNGPHSQVTTAILPSAANGEYPAQLHPNHAYTPPQASSTNLSASRRNTAPADFFSKPVSASASVPVAIPLNTIITTISAAGPPEKPRRRSRLSFLKRSSVQSPVERPVTPPSRSITPLPPMLSAPDPTDRPNQLATFKFTTAADVAAQTKVDEEKLRAAVDVIRRDKPKDRLDSGWTEQERAEGESRRMIGQDMFQAGTAPTSPRGDGLVKRREWGK